MNELFKATFWFTFGALFMLGWLALPLAVQSEADDALAISSLRDLGCEPFISNTGALHSGCDKVKSISLKFGEPK